MPCIQVNGFKKTFLKRNITCFPKKCLILPGIAHHKRLSGESGSLKLPSALSFPCSIHHRRFTGRHRLSYPPFLSVNSDPTAAKLVRVAYSKAAGIYSHTLGTAPKNLTGGLVLSLTEDS